MNWKEGLSEEYKEAPAFKDIGDDINDLAKNFVDLQAHLGNSIRIPSNEAGEDDVKAFHAKLQEKVPGLIPTPTKENPDTIDIFYKALGKPDKHEEYTLPEVEGINIEDNQAELYRKSAFNAGMTTDQLNAFMQPLMEADLSALEVTQNSMQEDQLALKKEWGVTFEKRKEGIVNNLLLSEAPSDLTEAIKEGTAPSTTVKWLHALFEKINDGGTDITDNKDEGQGDGITPDEARERANEIRTWMTKPDSIPSSPEYQAKLKKLLHYEKMANPESSTDFNDLRTGFTSGR